MKQPDPTMHTPAESRPARAAEVVRPSQAALNRRTVPLPVTRAPQVLQSGRAPAQLPLFLRSASIDVR